MEQEYIKVKIKDDISWIIEWHERQIQIMRNMAATRDKYGGAKKLEKHLVLDRLVHRARIGARYFSKYPHKMKSSAQLSTKFKKLAERAHSLPSDSFAKRVYDSMTDALGVIAWDYDTPSCRMGIIAVVLDELHAVELDPMLLVHKNPFLVPMIDEDPIVGTDLDPIHKMFQSYPMVRLMSGDRIVGQTPKKKVSKE